MSAKTFSEILKFNQNHDRLGRFSSSPGGGGAAGMKISTFSTGASGSEVYMRSEMKDGDKVAGYVEYSIYDNVPAIQYIHTEEGYERQGVATKLMQDLQSQYPETEIQFGMTTPDGTKFLDSITYEVKDEKVAEQKQKMDSMKEELAQNEAELNRLYEKIDNNTITEAESETLGKLGDRWDELNDGIRNLEDELWGKKETKRFVALDTKKSITFSEGTNEMSSFKIFKADEDQRLVFGWASVAITIDGEELEDMQHDMIDPEELEEAAYEYVLNFRDTGEEHLPGYRKKGRLVESCVFTPDKQKAMGIPEGILPVAWWIGFKIDDDDAWRRIKDGTYRMFSIEGKAQREPVQKAAYDEWLEENMDKFTSDEEELKFAQWKSPSGFRARNATDVDEVDMQWNEYKNTMLKKADKPTGCGVLVVRDGKVLTGTRIERASRGQICGPGGHIEAGETPEEAAKREAEEEFGIICNDLVPLGVQSGGGRYGTSAVFMCTDYSGEPKTDEEEMTAPKWMSPEEISAADAFPPFMQSLELLPRRGTIAKSFEEILANNHKGGQSNE